MRILKALVVLGIWGIGLWLVWRVVGFWGTVGVCLVAYGYVEANNDMRGL